MQNRIFIFSLALTLMFPAILPAGTPVASYISTPSHFARISILDSNPSRLSIECRFDLDYFQSFESDGEFPVVTRWLVTPIDEIPVIENLETTISEMPLTVDNPAAAITDASHAASIGEPIIQRGIQLVPVTFQPWEVERGAIKQLESIRVEIALTKRDGDSRRLRPVMMEMWGDLILNRDFPGRDRENETNDGLYVYVIPDNNDVRNTVNALIQWRRQQGFETREIAVAPWTDASFIKDQLIAIEASGRIIDYVTLVGDVEGNFPVPTFHRGVESDYYYALLEGNDYIPDAAVGRLSFNSLAELERIVEKILQYEQEPDVDDPGWLRRGAVAAGSRISGLSTILVSRWLRDKMLDNGYTSVDTLWYSMGETVGDYMENQFNRGVSFVSYRGWTGLEDWAPIQAGSLRNRYLPVATLLACNSGDYAGNETGFTEALLRARGGAIAAIGVAGQQSRVNFNNAMLASFYNGYFDEGAYRIGWMLNRARIDLMGTYGSNERELTLDHSAWTNLMGDPATIIWRGTPRTVRISAPQNVDYGTGTVTATVVDAQNNQPVANVRVGLSKGSELAVAAYTNNNGQAIIRFDNRRLSPGQALLTASGDRILPATAQVQMNRPARTLTFLSSSIIDTNLPPNNGDGDGVAEPNEMITISVQLQNIGTQMVPAPTDCELETESPYCNIMGANYRIVQGINPNTAGTANFLVSLGSNFPNNVPIPFTITARNNETVWVSEFSIIGQGASWSFIRTDLVRSPNPGETPTFDIFLKNTGNFVLGITQAVLVCDNPMAEVIDAEGEYDTLSIGEIDGAGRVYTVSFDQDLDYGTEMEFRLNLTGEGNYTAAIPFTITLGQLPPNQPTGPDAYGYYAIDQQDLMSNLKPNFDWIEINPRLGGPGVNTGLLDQGEDDDESVVLDLPFTVSYYGRNYDQITVCTNGWAAFGSQPGYVDFRNLPIGSPQGPVAQLCPWWTDLYQPGVEAGVFYYFDAQFHRFFIEWYRMRQWVGPAGPGGVETFQIILQDPRWHQNPSGDGDIYFVYNEITHEARVDAHGTPYATVGIGSPDDTGGLQLAFWNKFEPGATPPNAGVIYRFVTADHQDYALIKGYVRREGDNLPVQGAIVRATRGGWTSTNNEGFFRIQAAIANTPQQVEVTKSGYNNGISEQFNIAANDSFEVIVTLRQPQAVIDVEEFSDSLDAGELAVHHFNLRNPGTGQLSVTTHIVEHNEGDLLQTNLLALDRDDPEEMGDRLLSIPVTGMTGDSRILGVAFDNENFIISGGNSGGEINAFYRFDGIGEFIDRLNQPVADLWGLHDLAWNQGRLFGCVGEWIVEMNRQGQETERIDSPIIPARGFAVSPDGDFWVTGENQPILWLSPDGETRQSFRHSLNIYGLAWHPADPDGCPLWIAATDNVAGISICKMDTSSGRIYPVWQIEGEDGDHPGGIEITNHWNDRLWCLTAVIQNQAGDRVEVFDIGKNLSWVEVSPSSALIEANQSREFTVEINSGLLAGGDYSADVLIEHNANGGELSIPVNVYVEPVLAGVDPDLPAGYALEGIYPNPSNGTAIIRFTLPISGQVELKVFDYQGRVIGDIIEGRLPAGSYSRVFDALPLPAGIYMIQLQTEHGSVIRKFALIK